MLSGGDIFRILVTDLQSWKKYIMHLNNSTSNRTSDPCSYFFSSCFFVWLTFDRSCLLWVKSTEISVNIVLDIAVDTRSIVGRYAVDTRSIRGWQLVDIAVDSRSTLGRDMVDSRSRCVSADIAFRSPTLRRHFADTSPIVDRYCLDRCIGQ